MKRVVSTVFFALIVSLALSITMRAKTVETTNSNLVEVTNTVISVAGADVTVAKERSSVSSAWIIKFFSPRDLEQKKTELIEVLKNRTKADVIIDPQFTITKKRLGGGRITLTGYPAYYSNFRNLTPTEVDSLIIYNKYQSGSVVFFDKSDI